MKRIMLLVILVLFSLNAYSHRGQAKSSGCHKGSSSKYHCHNSRSRNNKSCGTSRIRDCNNNCSRKKMWGDGDCDSAFNCARFDYDRWDCVDPPSDGTTSTTPIKCGIEKIRDCNNFCNWKTWWGDGDCDAFYNCAKLSYDHGDCKSTRDTNGRTTPPITPPIPSCATHEIRNCKGSCSLVDLLGNGHCDSSFNCDQFSYDRRDCIASKDKVTSPAISTSDANILLRQCTDSAGNITFSDLPCPNETREHFIGDKTLTVEAEEAASHGISKMSELAYQEAGEYFEQAATLLPLGNDEKRAEYLMLGGYAFQKALLYNKSIALFEYALVIKGKVYGQTHPQVATVLHNLAGLYYTQGDYDKSKPMYEQALAIFEKVLGKEHLSTRTVTKNYRIMLEKMGGGLNQD